MRRHACCLLRREHKCEVCQASVFKGQAICKLTQGPLKGRYVHRSCALRLIAANKMGEDTPLPPLQFKEPDADIVDAIHRFFRGEAPVVLIKLVAGGGKTNILVYAVHVAREM